MRALAGSSHSDSLLLDSGATWHITGKDSQVHPLSHPVTVSAVQGEVKVEEGGLISNQQLHERTAPDSSTNLEAIHVPGAPEVGALGKLIKDYKLSFTWKWDEFETPMLVDVEGRQLTVTVEADCPMLAAVSKGGKTTSQPAPPQRLEKPAGETSQLPGVILEQEPSNTHLDMDEPVPASRFLGLEMITPERIISEI